MSEQYKKCQICGGFAHAAECPTILRQMMAIESQSAPAVYLSIAPAVASRLGPVMIRCDKPNDPEATIWRWKTSWGSWTYRKELPAGWQDLGSIEAYRIASEASPAVVKPVDMILFCPNCGEQHIDQPELRDRYRAADGSDDHVRWTNPPHRSHLCHGCGHIWRPADVPTNGVAAIQTQGKNDSPVESNEPERRIPRVHGVSRLADNPCALLLLLMSEPTDDDLRSIHDALSRAARTGEQS